MRTALLLATGCLLLPLAWADAGGAREIVQQRLPDGRIVFTDRPQPGATVERRWQFAPHDAAEAEAQRAARQREAEAVSERIARQLEQERQDDLAFAIARLQAEQARAEREAARAAAEPVPVFAWPLPVLRPYPPGLHQPPPQRPRLGPKVPPTKRFTPPPGPNVPEEGRYYGY